MLKMVGRRLSNPATRPASGNNTANNEEKAGTAAHQQPRIGSAAAGMAGVVETNEHRSRKSVKIKTPTIDDDCHFRQNSTRCRALRRASHSIGRWSSAVDDDDAHFRISRRNKAMSRSVKVKSTYSKSPDHATSVTKRALRPVLSLTQGQKVAIQNTWRLLKEHHGEKAAEHILQKLVNDQPKVKDVFYQAAFLTVFTRSNTITTFRDHSRLLYRTLDDCVDNLDCASGYDRVMRELRASGARHAFLRKSGFKPEVWERFGEAAVDVIAAFECVKSNPEAGKAWTNLIASITDELRNGFESEARKLSYASERPKSACE